jgi:transcription elongation factor GreA
MDQKQDRVYLTKEGLEKLRKEFDHLIQVRRPEVIERIAQARQASSSPDNLELDTATEEQSFIEGRITDLTEVLKRAEVIPAEKGKKAVSLGSTVIVEVEGERDEFTLVGSLEADPSRGLISNESIVGKALLGAKIGDVITVSSAAEATYKVLEIK